MKILFLIVIIAQVVSFTSQGGVYGFRKIFHWLLPKEVSMSIIKNIPNEQLRAFLKI